MVNLVYDDIACYAKEILVYATKHSDYFSVIISQKKPYSTRPPICDYDDVLKPIYPQLVTQFVGIRKWSESGINNNHTVMNLYRCCKETRLFLCACSKECFDYGDFPEDICFYRGRTTWLSTTTHEGYASMYGATQEDISFLRRVKIKYSNAGNIRPYQLPSIVTEN